jgi:SHS family lactate transporter-like MFS transporter
VKFGFDDGWRTGYVIIGAATIVIGLFSAFLLPESEQWLHYRRELRTGRVPETLRTAKVPLVDLFRRKYAGGMILFIILPKSPPIPNPASSLVKRNIR